MSLFWQTANCEEDIYNKSVTLDSLNRARLTMTDKQKPHSSENLPNSSSSSSSSSSDSKLPTETSNTNTNYSGQKVRYPNPREPSYTNTNCSGPNVRFPNPPDATNPDPATLREQWRFAIKQYSRWYSHAWGTAILAGLSFFALGWIIKGSNPLPSFKDDSSAPPDGDGDGDRAAGRHNAK